MFNIVDYGAVPDGKALNTAAIQNAIDTCNAAGGGQVVVPAGIFKTGTIWLKSNVELHLSMGATLLASDNMDDYNELDAYPENFSCIPEGWVGKHLIIAYEAENIAITGFGTVDGNCYAFLEDDHENENYWYRWRSGSCKCKGPEQLRPGQTIAIILCKHVTVHDITVRNSGCWSVFLLGCEYVGVRGYKVFNALNIQNSDGLDIDCCRHVTVSDCIIHSGDDGITVRCAERLLKEKAIHSEYINITNCVIHVAICAFRLGVGTGAIRHVNISGITVSRCRDLLQFATAYERTGCACMEDIRITNISATDTDKVLALVATNGAYVKNVTMENIRCDATAMSYIRQNDGIVDNVRLRNVEITAVDRYDLFNANHLKMRGNCIFSVKNATNVVLEDVRIRGDLAQITDRTVFTGCDDILIKDCSFE